MTGIVGDDGALRELSGDSAALARALLSFLTSPRSHAEIAAHLGELAGVPVAIDGAVAELLAILQQGGAIVESEPALPASAQAPRRRLVLALTGGIAASSAPMLVPILQARGFEVRVAATRRALRFVSALALEALTHARVCASMWPTDARAPVPHLELATWADLVLVFPASATSIARISQGNCATLVSALAISTRAPVLFIPSMNERMATSPGVLRNLDQLRDDGFFVAHPGFGHEVAEQPAARVPMLGTAPPLGVIADLAEAVAARHPVRSLEPGAVWDALYASTPIDQLPWYRDALDADIVALLDDLSPRTGRFLDVGTGPGTAAIEAARRGFTVVATDISPAALDLAAARAGALPIAFVVDDAGSSRLRGTFEVIHDRGCLHALPAEVHAAYAASVAARAAPSALFILKVMSDGEPEAVAVHRFDRAAVEALFGRDFAVIHVGASTISGPLAPRRALLFALRRRSAPLDPGTR